MAVYSCNYPVWHTFDTSINEIITYSIYISDTQIYTGKLFPYDTIATTLDIDISEICREYLETFYENITINGVTSGLTPTNGMLSTIITFTVQSDHNAAVDNQGETIDQIDYTVIYDYNTDYHTTDNNNQFPEIRHLNDPIDNKVDPRQILFINGYNLTETSQQYTWQVNNDAINSATVNAGPTTRFQSVAIPLNTLTETNTTTLQEGSTITITMTNIDSRQYTVTPPCANRYALYYVNKYGGLDTLLVSGKHTQSWNPDHTDIQIYTNRESRTAWQQKRINSQIDHKWELNTGLLTNENTAKIDHLIYSPKVMLHDLENDTITTVLINDTTYSTKQHPYDIPQYTITVKESQQQQRR